MNDPLTDLRQCMDNQFQTAKSHWYRFVKPYVYWWMGGLAVIALWLGMIRVLGVVIFGLLFLHTGGLALQLFSRWYSTEYWQHVLYLRMRPSEVMSYELPLPQDNNIRFDLVVQTGCGNVNIFSEPLNLAVGKISHPFTSANHKCPRQGVVRLLIHNINNVLSAIVYVQVIARRLTWEEYPVC